VKAERWHELKDVEPTEVLVYRTVGPNRRQRRAKGYRHPYTGKLVAEPSQNIPYRKVKVAAAGARVASASPSSHPAAGRRPGVK